MTVAARDLEQFVESGYLGPLRILSPEECVEFLRAVEAEGAKPLDWEKGAAATSPAYYGIATRPEIVDVLVELLGGDVILWGASIVERAPGQRHPWHTDIESAAPDGATASVWIGLENTTPDSSLVVVTHSHRLGLTLQEARLEHGAVRDEAETQEIQLWAQEHDKRARAVTAGAGDGEAVFFDGRLWHGTHNVSDRTRRALLLQYAQPRTAIRIPDLRHLDWPFRLLDRPRPPCIVVHGHADAAINRIVPAPPTGGAGRPLTSQIHRLRLPLRTDVKTGWRPHPVFSGRTTEVPELACHASTLLPGRSPHLPHAHPEEELLLVLAGEVELELPAAGTVRLRPGELVYYPAGFAHTLRTASVEPSTYVMLKWREEPVDEGATLPFGRFATDVPGVLFEGPTSCLRKLHAHVTVLEPGGGYEPHADAYDVVVVVLEGEVETIGGIAAPHDVVLYRASHPHGMRCAGDGRARYVVFELHGRARLGGASRERLRLGQRLKRLAQPARAALDRVRFPG